jgi:2'-5' RNA ligase
MAHTGAMIALVPSEADAARLAVDGGEPVEELHLTISYLGKADAFDAAARQRLITATTAAVRGMRVVDADIFAVAAFNPGGPEPCNVVLVGGEHLDAIHRKLRGAVPPSTEQHAPWHAHVTLEFSGDVERLAQLTGRLGPVRFDRVRIAFAGENFDIPLLDGDRPDRQDEPLAEAYNSGQLRDPGGEHGGQWVSTPGTTWADVVDSYGPTHDEAEAGDFTIAVFQRGDFTLFYRPGGDRFEAVRELDGDYAEQLAGRLDEFADDAGTAEPGDPGHGDEVVDYMHIGDSDALVGRTGDGMVVFSASKSGDREPDLHVIGNPAADQFHLAPDDARGLAGALRDMTERFDELDGTGGLVEGSAKRRGAVSRRDRSRPQPRNRRLRRADRQLAERFDPSQPRNRHGEWARVLAAAEYKVGKSTLRLTHHGDGQVSVHDEHGGSLHLSRDDLKGGRRPGRARNFAYGTHRAENVGDRDWLGKLEDRGGKPWTTALAGIHTTHITDSTGDDDDEPYLNDRHTLHLAAGGKGVDDHEELYSRPGTPMTTRELQGLADTLKAFADGHDDVDTGNGRVVMGVTGKDFTLDTGRRGERPIVLNRGEVRNVQKALNAAYEAHDPDDGDPLPAGEKFQATVPTKRSGDIVVTRTGPDADFWIESDTTAIRIKPVAFNDVTEHLDAMLALSGNLKHLTPVATRPVAESTRPVGRVLIVESGQFQAL